MNNSEETVNIKRFVFNPFMENTYVIWNTLTLEAMIVDPGNSIPEEDMELTMFINEHGLKLKYLINTHGHIDHILGNSYVLSSYKVEHLIPEKDLYLFSNASQQAAMFGIEYRESPLAARFIDESAKLSLGDILFEFIYTPGHTPGEFCIYFPYQKLLIAGDVLFLESIGRTDLPGGNTEQLLNSIKEKLFVLPLETVVLPGHGESTSIDFEIKNNPFFY